MTKCNFERISPFFPSDQDLFTFGLFHLINATPEIHNACTECFISSDDLTCHLIEQGTTSGSILLPLDYEEFEELLAGERQSLILPPDFMFEHEDLVFLIELNENNYPTGRWILSELMLIDYSYPACPSLGLEPEFSLVEFNHQSFHSQ